MSFNVDIRDQLAAKLRARGFEVLTTDANANDDPKISKVTHDLLLAIHYDSDSYGKGGGFTDYPGTTDLATEKSKTAAKAIADEFFKATGIVNHPERSNANTKGYYIWAYMTKDTPKVIVECGVGMHVPDDHTTLHFNRKLVVEGLERGICKYFDMPFETPQPPPAPAEPTITITEKRYNELVLAEQELVKYKDKQSAIAKLLEQLLAIFK